MSRILANSLSPLQGGSESRNSDTTSKLQILQQFSVAGNGTGNQIRSEKDRAIYVGMVNPTDRLAEKESEVGTKEEKEKMDKKGQSTAVGASQ